MNGWARASIRLYRALLAFYPQRFRSAFGEEMQGVFQSALLEVQHSSGMHTWQLLWREFRDWPRSVWREHLQARRKTMFSNNPAWRPLNIKELLAGLVLFALPIFPSIVRLIFGYNTITLNVVNAFIFIVLITGFVIIVLGVKNGFPRWSLPYLGAAVISLIMLQAVYPLWGLFADNVRMMINYSTRTLIARIQYSVLLDSFFWLVSFTALALLILLLMVWPRTRVLAQRIRQDWTLMSFMIYSALVFDLELIFEEYAHDEVWKIASRICLFLGAWIYFKNAEQHKRILALLAGATLYFGIAAVGQWVVLPLQSWGDFYGYDHWTYRRVILSGTLTGWVSTLLFMLIPALINLTPRLSNADPTPEENFTPA